MAIELGTGKLEFRVTLPDGSVVDWEADLVELKLITDQLERASKLDVVDGFYVPTAEFLRDLSEAYAVAGCPAKDSTLTKSIWNLVNAKFNQYVLDVNEQVAKAIKE